jgi:hypothetical protein
MPILPPSAGEEIEPLSGGAAGQQRAGKNEMARVTPEELDYIRTAAIGDMLGDSRAFDEMGPSAVIFGLRGDQEAPQRAQRKQRVNPFHHRQIGSHSPKRKSLPQGGIGA